MNSSFLSTIQGPIVAVLLSTNSAREYLANFTSDRPYFVLFAVIYGILLFPMSALITIGGVILLSSCAISAAIYVAIVVPALLFIGLFATALWGAIVAMYSIIRLQITRSRAHAAEKDHSPANQNAVEKQPSDYTVQKN